MLSREQRKEKRRLKKAVFFEKHRLIKQLFGDETIGDTDEPKVWHWPTRSLDSNHKRVVMQRIQSGRLDTENYRKVKH